MARRAEVTEAVRRLRAGECVAFPTETVYGLGAIATDAAAVAGVFDRKGRPAHNPLIVHVDSAEMASRVAAGWDDRCAKLAAAFWPGPLSIVTRRDASIPDVVTGGLDTVAVRCPDHPLTLALIGELGEPIVGPSANPSGSLSPTSAAHVAAAFDPDPPFILDGGPCRAGIESTVVDCSRERVRILRPGVIGHDEIGEAIGAEVDPWAEPEAGEPAASPGLIGPHYKPRASVELIDADDIEPAPGVVYLLRTADRPVEGWAVRMPEDAEGYAAELYAALRVADGFGPLTIRVERPPEHDPDPKIAAIWRAITERLGRAASG